MPDARHFRTAAALLAIVGMLLLVRSVTTFTVEGSAQNSNAWEVVSSGCNQDEGEAVSFAEPGEPPVRGAKARCEREGAFRVIGPVAAFGLASVALLASRPRKSWALRE